MKTDIHVCPECGAVDWGSYPTLRGTLQLVERRKRLTSRELADIDAISIQAATNRLTRLMRAGLLHVVEERTVDGGGRERVFAVHPPWHEGVGDPDFETAEEYLVAMIEQFAQEEIDRWKRDGYERSSVPAARVAARVVKKIHEEGQIRLTDHPDPSTEMEVCPRCRGPLDAPPTAMGDGQNDCPHCGWDLSREWTEADD